MKRNLYFIVLAITLNLYPAYAQENRNRTIQVIGSASARVIADRVTVSIGVSTEGIDARSALEDASKRARQIIDFAKNSGIPRENITTQTINVSTAAEFKTAADGKRIPNPSRYTASLSISVEIDNQRDVGLFLRNSIDQGASRISGVEFNVRDTNEIMRTLRADAVRDAKSKAQAMLAVTGNSVGAIEKIFYPVREELREGRTYADMPMRGMNVSVPVEAGTVVLEVKVDTIWAID